MWKIIVIILVALIITLIDFPTLKKRKLNREVFLFFALLLIGIGLNIVSSLNLKVPTLIDWLIIVYQPISQLVFRWLS